MSIEKKIEIFNKFANNITPERKAKIESVASQRTYQICVVLEDIQQSHNTSAVLRSCECFGIQKVNIIEQRNSFALMDTVSKGSAQWLDIARFKGKGVNNTEQCFNALRAEGYKIISTSPHANDMLLSDLPMNEKTALVFGTEQEGISEYAKANSDGFIKIPMYGFTESFNISVCAAICLYDISNRLRSSGDNWKLTPEELIDLKLKWLGKTTYYSDMIDAMLKEL